MDESVLKGTPEEEADQSCLQGQGLRGSRRSEVGCQGWELRDGRGRATEVVPCWDP